MAAKSYSFEGLIIGSQKRVVFGVVGGRPCLFYPASSCWLCNLAMLLSLIPCSALEAGVEAVEDRVEAW